MGTGGGFAVCQGQGEWKMGNQKRWETRCKERERKRVGTESRKTKTADDSGGACRVLCQDSGSRLFEANHMPMALETAARVVRRASVFGTGMRRCFFCSLLTLSLSHSVSCIRFPLFTLFLLVGFLLLVSQLPLSLPPWICPAFSLPQTETGPIELMAKCLVVANDCRAGR
jgi:hypothetical protein